MEEKRKPFKKDIGNAILIEDKLISFEFYLDESSKHLIEKVPTRIVVSTTVIAAWILKTTSVIVAALIVHWITKPDGTKEKVEKEAEFEEIIEEYEEEFEEIHKDGSRKRGIRRGTRTYRKFIRYL